VYGKLFLSSSERNEDKIVFPLPAAPLIHRIFDGGFLACQWRNLGCFRIQVQVPSTRRLTFEIAVVDVDALKREAINPENKFRSLSSTM
jgi:hypothetical protein